MSCETWHEQLIGLLDDELTAGERAALEAHLRECEQCREDLAELRTTSAVLQRWKPEDPPSEFVFVRRSRRRRLRELFAGLGPRALLPAGLGAVAAVAITLLVLHGQRPDARVQALRAEVLELNQRLAQTEAILAAPGLLRAGAPGGAVGGADLPSGPEEPMPTPLVRLAPSERTELLRAMQELIRDSETRQDAKFLFTTDQLARSLSIQRREDLRAVDRHLRDVRAETFSALVTTNERVDQIVAPSFLEPTPPGDGTNEGRDGEPDFEDGERWRGPGERLEPR
jgi:hypothetical protein